MLPVGSRELRAFSEIMWWHIQKKQECPVSLNVCVCPCKNSNVKTEKLILRVKPPAVSSVWPVVSHMSPFAD